MTLPITDMTPGHVLPPGLRHGTPAEAGLDGDQLRVALDVAAEAVAAGRLPGAVAVVIRNGVVAAHRAIGWAQYNPEADRRPMMLDTLFDVASLTKVMATLPSVLTLLDRGALRLDDRLTRFFPAFVGEWKDDVRVRHLLTHTAGLAPWLPLEKMEGTREERIQRVLAAPLQEKPGTKVVYSDLSFILLGEIVAQVSGLPLDQYVRDRVFRPLGLADAGFNPAPALQNRCAATEYREYLGRHQVGEVHDERATCLGGVAGHAGLFATGLEVAAYGEMWLRDGVFAPVGAPAPGTPAGVAGVPAHGSAGQPPRILSAAMIAAATRDHTPGLPDSRGLGWIVLRPDAEFMSCGDLFTPGSFGHTGFTGTTLWADPARRLVTVLMTNSVHFGRTDAAIQLRPRFYNAVAAAVR